MKRSYPFLTLGIAGCILVGGTQITWADPIQAVPLSAAVITPVQTTQMSTISVTSKDVNKETNILKATLRIPTLSGMKDTRYQAELNDIIERHAMEDLANLEKQAQQDVDAARQSGYEMRPYELDVRYEVKSAGGIDQADRISLKIQTYTYTGGANGMPRIDTYNLVDEAQAKLLTLTDLFGDDYKPIIDTAIQQAIQANPEKYFKDAFQGISESQAFYVDKGDVVIVFQKYDIAPGAAGNPEFRIPLPTDAVAVNPSTPSTVSLSVNGQALLPENAAVYVNQAGVKMVPLRAVTAALGYSLTWNAELRQAELSKGAQWTAVQEGSDAYIINKMAPIKLGTAPVIRDEKLYVPLAFFSDILKQTVTNTNGEISIHSPK